MTSQLKVNGADMVTLRHDPVSRTEALFTVTGSSIVNITYDEVGRPLSWEPVHPQLVPTTVAYDPWGHITR